MNERYKSRKLWMCLIGMTFAAGLRLRGIVLDEGTVTVLVVGMVGYCGTNVWQKKVDATKEVPK